MFSYIDHLECTQCGKTYPHDQISKISDCCGKVLFARYDLPRLRREGSRDVFASRDSNMWRFSELMPVTESTTTLLLWEKAALP